MPITAREFDSQEQGSAPARRAIAVVPSDVDELTFVARALRINGAGTIRFQCVDDTAGEVQAWNVVAGEVIHCYVRKVFATGTTATGITAFHGR